MDKRGRLWAVRLLLVTPLLGLLAVLWLTLAAPASIAATACDLSGTTATVQLDAAGGTTTLSYDGSNLLVDGSSCGAFPSTVDLEVGNGAPAQTAVLNQTGTGGVFPCTTTVSGTLRGSDVVTVLGAASENLVVGDTATGTGVNLDGCSSVGTITGVGSYRVVAGSGTNTLSAAGGSPFVSALTVPAVLEPADGSSQTLLPGLAEDTIDFSAVSNALTVNVSGSPVAGTNSGEASTTGPVTYDFTAFGSSPVIVDGASAATTFWAGTTADTFNGESTSDVLSFANSSSSSQLTLCADDSAGASACSASGRAVLGSTVEPFSGIATFDSLPAGNSTFAAGATSGQAFNATGTGNSADFSADPDSVTVDVGAGTASDGSGTHDDLSGVSRVVGSAGGGNTFVAGAASETFADVGSSFTHGADTVDFSNVVTSNVTPLVVSVPSHNASVGATTYSFGTGANNFLDFVAPAHTTYLANGSPGYSFTGADASDSIDFSAASSGVSVDLSASPGTVAVTGGSDTVTGLTTVTGSSAGGNTFTGGSGGPYSFTGSGTNNDFAVGTGSVNILGSQPGNTVDFSALASPLTVNVSGGPVGPVANGTAASGAATYTFTSIDSAPTTFIGADGAATTFYAGSVADTFTGKSGSDVLTFANSSSSSSLTLCADASDGATGCGAAGRALLGATVEPFNGIATFDGLPAGNSTFVAGATSGQTFNALGSNNQADFSPDPDPVTVDLHAGTASDGSETDHLSGVSTVLGSAGGGNTFVAGAGNESFGDHGTSFANGKDAIDFSNVATGNSSPLLVNLTGATVSGPVLDHTASVGTTTYSFTEGATNFLDFVAPDYTTYLVGDSPGYDLTGTGSHDAVDFSAATSGVSVDLTTSPGTAAVGGGSDTLSGLTTVTGSSGGGNSLTAGAGGPYVLNANGNDNRFIGGAGNATFNGNGTGDTFAVGTGSVAIDDTSPGNVFDFSAVGKPLTVDLRPIAGFPTDTASTVSSEYNFDVGAGVASTFIGATGGKTTFYSGSAGGDTFTGQGTGNDVDTTAAPAGTTINLVTGQIDGLASGSSDTFSGIQAFAGPDAGSSTFVAGDTAGDSFLGRGTGNGADFSADPHQVTVDLNAGTATDGSSGTDMLSDISNVAGSADGGNTFVAGIGIESFSNLGSAPFTHGADTVDFSNVGRGPLGVNVSGGPVVPAGLGGLIVPIAAAATPSSSYTFSTDAAATTFIGSTDGNTTFYSGSAGGDGFTGQGAGNSLNTVAAPSGETISLVTGTVSGLTSGGSDTFADIQSFFGSPAGGTTFLASNTGGYLFSGAPAGGNVLDLTAASTPALDIPHGTVTGLGGPGEDTFAGIQLFRLNLRFTSTAPAGGVVGGSYAPTATGTGSSQPVVFSVDGATTNNACSVVNGRVQFNNTGECVIDANQAGDGQFLAAPTISQQIPIGPAATTTTVRVTPQQISATVLSGGGMPTGTVTFSVDGSTVGTASLVNGVATLATVVPPGASHTVAAVYAGNGDFTGSSGSTARDDPSIKASVTSAYDRTRFGWYRSPVTVTFTCTSTSAPLVAPCPEPVTLSGQGAGQSVTRTITATDGGAATAVVSPINIDMVAPRIHVHGVTPGSTYKSAPPMIVHATDRLSGVAHVHVTRTRSTRNRVTTVHYRIKAVDKAGNVRVVKGYYRIKR